MPISTFTPNAVIASAAHNSNWALAVLTDTARTITVTHTWSASQTFSAGVAITGNSTVVGTLTSLTGITSSGTAAFATVTASGTLAVTGATTLSAALTYGGVALSNAVTGTDNMVLSASPTLTGTITAAAINASGAVATGALTVTGAASVSTTLGVTGAVTLSSTLAVAGAITATGGQIVFPAVQVASANVNTLDDYEEGTFTPTVATGVTSPTYADRHGTYLKIGRLVYFEILINVNGGTRNGSALTFGALPFTSEATNVHAAYWGYTTGFYASVLIASVSANSTTIGVYTPAGADVLGTDLVSANPAIRISGTYLAAN